MTVTNLNIFQSGTIAAVTPVNENFETLRVAVNSVEQTVTENRTYLNNKVSEINGKIDDSTNSIKTSGEIFCINSGSFNASGKPEILTVSGTTLSFVTPFSGRNIKGKTLDATTVSDVSILGLTDGTHNVFIDLNGAAEVLNNTIYRQDTEPTAVINDIWVNTSKAPITAKIYTNSGWEEFLKIPIGSLTVSSGDVTSVTTFNYNQNGYNINTASLFPMPDYTKGVNKTNGTTYTAATHGWIFAFYAGANSGSASLTIDGTSFIVSSLTYTGVLYGTGNGIIFPIGKGSKYKGTNLTTYKFFPTKTI